MSNMSVDLSQITNVSTEPGELPPTMTAWVIRQEREGEPIEAFQLEEIEVPEPAAVKVIVRVMAAGVNFNGVWPTLGTPVSVFGYGDHPEYGHHIGGSLGENKHAGKIAVLVGASEENQGRSGEPPAEPPAIRAEIGA